MNKEKLEERLKTLETEQAQLKNNLVAYEGAIQDCKYWLEQLKDDVVKPKTKAV
jgi:predicted nuclease with TOPRIM domain